MAPDLTSRVALELARARMREQRGDGGAVQKGTYDEAKHLRGFHGRWVPGGAVPGGRFNSSGGRFHEDQHGTPRDSHGGEVHHVLEVRGIHFGHVSENDRGFSAHDRHGRSLGGGHEYADSAKQAVAGAAEYQIERRGLPEKPKDGLAESKVRTAGSAQPRSVRPPARGQRSGTEFKGGRGSKRARPGGDLGETHAAQNAARNARGKR